MALRGQRGDATVCAHAAHSATPCNRERRVGRGARGDRGTRAGKAGPRPQVRGCRLIQVAASGKHQLFSGRPGGLRSLRPRGPSPPTAPESGFHGRGVTGTLEEGAASPSRRPQEGLSQTGAPRLQQVPGSSSLLPLPRALLPGGPSPYPPRRGLLGRAQVQGRLHTEAATRPGGCCWEAPGRTHSAWPREPGGTRRVPGLRARPTAG